MDDFEYTPEFAALIAGATAAAEYRALLGSSILCLPAAAIETQTTT